MIFFLLFVGRDGAVGADKDGEESHEHQAPVGDHHALRCGGNLNKTVLYVIQIKRCLWSGKLLSSLYIN